MLKANTDCQYSLLESVKKITGQAKRYQVTIKIKTGKNCVVTEQMQNANQFNNHFPSMENTTLKKYDL